MTPKLYLVGGSVRDKVMGRPVKDYDFAVEADSYDDMLFYLKSRGAIIWQERPEFLSIRCKFPLAGVDWPAIAGLDNACMWVPADFTMCRTEDGYDDKRHPSSVTPAKLEADLSRRDFTMNAMAIDEEGMIHDPFDGHTDLVNRVIRCVGDPYSRFYEDPLRIVRALRFAILLGFTIDPTTSKAMRLNMHLIDTLPIERIREELHRMFSFNWLNSMEIILNYSSFHKIVRDKYPQLWFKPTTEER